MKFSFDLYIFVEYGAIYLVYSLFFCTCHFGISCMPQLGPYGTLHFDLLYTCQFNLPSLTRSSPCFLYLHIMKVVHVRRLTDTLKSLSKQPIQKSVLCPT